MTAPIPTLEPFVRQRTVLLTTFRRDGTPVGTPISIAVDGDRAFVRTYDTAGKLKRIRHNPQVEVAPSTFRGTPTGPAFRARARALNGDEAAHAARLIARKHPILHGLLVPLLHRLRRNATIHIELTTPRHDILDSCLQSGVAERGGRSRLGSGADFLDGEEGLLHGAGPALPPRRVGRPPQHRQPFVLAPRPQRRLRRAM